MMLFNKTTGEELSAEDVYVKKFSELAMRFSEIGFSLIRDDFDVDNVIKELTKIIEEYDKVSKLADFFEEDIDWAYEPKEACEKAKKEIKQVLDYVYELKEES